MYILPIGSDSMATARVFKSGNSQAVRLPKEFRFDSEEVEILRRGDEVVVGHGLADLQVPVAEVEVGVRDHSFELRRIDQAGAEDRAVELDRLPRPRDREERRQSRDAVGHPIRRVLPRHRPRRLGGRLFCSCVHAPSIESRAGGG